MTVSFPGCHFTWTGCPVAHTVDELDVEHLAADCPKPVCKGTLLPAPGWLYHIGYYSRHGALLPHLAAPEYYVTRWTDELFLPSGFPASVHLSTQLLGYSYSQPYLKTSARSSHTRLVNQILSQC